MSQTPILLLAHGTPDVLSEMPEYLQHVTGGRPMPAQVIEELQHRYAEIGLKDEPLPEGPPLTRWTLRQAQLLANHTETTVFVGMRNWRPFIAEAIAEIKAQGVAHIRVLCLAPQYSRTSTGLYRRALDAAIKDAYADAPDSPLTYDFIAGWADEPLLAQAFTERLWPVWAEACALASKEAGTSVRVPVLFTAHSVPCRTIQSAPRPSAGERPGAAAGSGPQSDAPGQRPSAPPADGIQDYGSAPAGDPYPVECKQTAAAIARRLAPVGMTDRDWYFAFQSQGIAGAPWIGPTVEDTLKYLAEAGHKAVVIQPVGFLCDHVEILYDIDINFREVARALGMAVTRPASLNDSATLVRALAHVLEQQP